MYVLAIANQKGGVGKTTSAANLADSLARAGRRVLLIDLDPQGNATGLTAAQPLQAPDRFGIDRPLTVSDALHATQPNAGDSVQAGTLHQVAVPSGDHWSDLLQVAPANQDLAARGAESFAGADRRLEAALRVAPGSDAPDIVVIDCPPTLGPLFTAALHAADGVLLVSEPADNAVEGLPRTVSAIKAVWAEHGTERPQLLGIVATNVPTGETRATQLLEFMGTEYGPLLWDTIPRRAVVRQAEGAGAPVAAYGRDGRDVADAYDRIATKVLDNLTQGVAV